MVLGAAALFGCARARPSTIRTRPPSAGAPTPDSLAALFLQRFATASPAAFDSIDPDSSSQAVMHAAAKRKLTRQGNLGRVVWRDGKEAVLLLTGTMKADNGGDETNLVRHFSGFYQAAKRNGSWSIVRRLPIDTLNHIQAQALHVELAPGRGGRGGGGSRWSTRWASR